jgi:hypothetical protein
VQFARGLSPSKWGADGVKNINVGDLRHWANNG